MTINPLLMATVLSTGLIFAGGILFSTDRRTRATQLRVASVLSTYAPAIVQARKSIQGSGKPLLLSATATSFFQLLRIDRTRPDLYPTAWSVVTGIVMLFSILISSLLQFFFGKIGWFSAPFVCLILTRLVFSRFLTRRANFLYTQLPDALTMIVRSVRAGLPVPEALRVVSEEAQFPTSTEFTRLYDDLRFGGSVAEAMMKLAKRTAVLEYRFFAVSMALQGQSGGNLTEALDNLADVIRKRVALKQRAIALASEAKMTMYVLAGLPFVISGALAVINPAYIGQLIYTSAGRTILGIGIIFLSMGIGSMVFIIKKSTT